MTDVDRSVVATCPLGISLLGTGLSGVRAGRLAAPAPIAASVDSVSLLASERLLGGNERPTKAPEAVVAQAQAYAFAAAGAGSRKQTTTQHQHMWAFRGLEPWSDPA
ncbi:hypothetical protein H9Y04_01085 [Streptomyces sp. TRM66268-LWL]|uniref:Uncharacterized protein n=1 Tax=Streptomyces polyasparticus TaxID=2767826 RepID=A0ABR7S6Q6_9ACTN|nr:hypothetical protein [Streptomyces polyasparticus]MBC9711166.1 hypothetical protein [Streptomyces polyasparticus]